MSQTEQAETPFTALPAQVNLGELDHRIIKWWQASDVFARCLEQTAGGPAWVFYEGPPTANGTPGTHQAFVAGSDLEDLLPVGQGFPGQVQVKE